ncbi:MAG TPA: PhnD/SsuA/transferrin family substrate-binding protein [Spirochaetota bacterium]|nr:PhnD/SsuA/transferrin family substrate-binding protein [Spirochaetota bacterium]HRZ25675.1 PhnD/SsuA/transferrin family substrate-binding protein [Spirochaetota bacterium]
MTHKKNCFITIWMFLLLVFPGFFHQNGASVSAAAEKIHFAIVFPGGPDTGPEGDKIITQFLDILTRQTKIKRADVAGQYFNDIAPARAYIQKNRNCFIMGSIGFYLANRTTYNLVPLSLVTSEGKRTEQYYLIVKKGSYKSLADLKGKKISGNVLYEDAKFINNMVFENKINVGSYFVMQPTARPLSAVRKMNTGTVDAVLLTGMQYEALKQIPTTFQKIEVVYKSPEMPRLGFMMAETPATRGVKDEILGAMVKMTSLEEGKKVCNNFGISGFENIQPETLNETIAKYTGSN